MSNQQQQQSQSQQQKSTSQTSSSLGVPGVAGTAGSPAPPQQRPGASQQPGVSRTVIDHLNKTGFTRIDATARIESSHIATPAVTQNNLRPEPGTGNYYPNGLNSYYKSTMSPEKRVTSGPVSGPKYLPDGSNGPPATTTTPTTTTTASTVPASSSIDSSVKPTSAAAAAAAASARKLDKAPSVATQAQQQHIYNTHDRPYLALRDWTEKSLDLYKPELRRVLYPVFVHIYLDLISKGCVKQAKDFFEENAADHATLHYQDLVVLSRISLPAHIEENELTKAFRNNKYVIKVSRTTFDLLVYFLHEIEDIGGSAIIRIINQYIEAKITTARPSRFSTEYVLDPEEGLPGVSYTPNASGTKPSDSSSSSSTAQAGPQQLKLGRLPLDPDFEKDVEMEIADENKADPQECDLLIKEFQKMHTKESDSPFRSALPLPTYRAADIAAEIQAVKDSRNRITIGTTQTALPSVCMYTFHNTHDDLNNLTFSADASLVATGFADSFIKIWSLKGKRLKSVLRDDEYNYVDMNGVASENPDTSVLARRLVGHAGPVYGLSFSPDNRYLLSSSEDRSVRLWSTDTYTGLVAYKGHTGPVWDVSFGPFGHYFATASHDQTARLWSVDHIYPLRIFAGHLSDVDTVSFHPNSMYVVTGSSDKTCRLWDINRGNSVRVFTGHTGPINATAVSPDGRWLASAGEDNVINVWDLGSGLRLKTMRGHGRSSIYSLAFSQEGSVLVSSGADCTVRVWDVRRGTNDQGPEPIETYVDPSLAAGGGSGGVAAAAAAAAAAATDSSDDKNDKTRSGGSISGVSGKPGAAADFEGRKRKEVPVTADHLAVFNTKKTPVYKVQFTSRNLCIAGGAFMG
ncbi:uncharacterized protein SAPINGB_P004396 [Magnusiomyces paraingens]|uniref:TFIID subunit TAF5 NTD2 domain-containing protein n=1 Tax=Magnusiomyces paraingens TaxID=2606893 RepID=A0A5E8BU90_9ASCO|nr:uncharacterized protein SAPINGB_P004396 [Saprochaete ingens]VVT55043.1 unnamed protein product [Saprochaete ingens]